MKRIKQLLYQPIMKKHLSLLCVGFLLGILVFGFIKFDEFQMTLQKILSGLLGVFVAYLISYSNKPLNKLWSWKKFTGIRMFFGIVLNAALAYLLIIFALWAYNGLTGSSPATVIEKEPHLKLVILLLCASVVYNIAYFTFFSYNQFAREQLAGLKIQRKQAELQLATLKAQLSPHFLFNCINSLSALFHTNTQKAETFIRSMARSYEYTLDNYRKSLIRVQEELAFVESYAYLLKTRFGEGFGLEVDLKEEHLDSKIPPLTLQILIENAVKHNKTSPSQPIIVSISGNSTVLKVTNNKAPKSQAEVSTGIGLKNIASRYKILSNSKIQIEDTNQFTVTLPLLKHE